MLDKIKKERNYGYEDEITCSKECLANYEETVSSSIFLMLGIYLKIIKPNLY